MFGKDSQKDIKIVGHGNDIVNGDKITTIYKSQNNSKLSALFVSLKKQFENPQNEKEIKDISDDLNRYLIPRDPIGLEKKLEIAGKSHLEDDFLELKQIFNKKLIKFQNFEPAQEIFTFILAIILEKYRNIVKPMIRESMPERDILKAISIEIVSPIVALIQSEGCDDIMGLNSNDIEGMYHYLTGNCYINWVL
ncbi:hypothetical protein HZP20_16945 [Elizabethkingia anophelis]|nr:hypothetical protein [Elizabethkingia anophelis]